MKKLLLIFFLSSFIIYFLTSAGKTPYDYFTRLGTSFLQGKYYLTENPPWLSELVPGPDNTYYVIQPPMPALLSIPFLFLFGEFFQQQYLAHLLGAGLVILTMAISYSLKKDSKLAIYSGILIGFGGVVWYLAATGSVWYLGQVSAAFFLTAALYEALNKKRSILIGLFIGAAFLSRLHTILSLPLFLHLLSTNKQKTLLNYFYLGLGMSPFFLFNFGYNFIRFGTILDKGYFLIPGIYSEPWFSKGMLNAAYIPDHLKEMFMRLPNFFSTFPFIKPSWYGLAIWITTPAFIFSLRSSFKENVNKFLWLSILLIFTLIALRGGTGWTQFGYRYAVDFYPFLALLTIKGIASTGLKKHHWVLLFIGVLVNLWGVIWINKFDWISF